MCATDVHFWEHGAMGETKVTGPHVLCHEFSGVISKVGEGVTNLKVGKNELYTCPISVWFKYRALKTYWNKTEIFSYNVIKYVPLK